MSNVKVIGFPQSNFVWAVRIALAEKGVENELVPARPHSEAAAAHPLGKIPILVHGDRQIAESRAIIDYIDRTFDGADLVPKDAAGRIASDIWTSLIATSVEPVIVRQLFFAYMLPKTSDGSPDQAAIAQALPKVENILDVLERAIVEGELDGRFGRTDAYLVPILAVLAMVPGGGEMIARRPAIADYLECGMARPSVRSTMPPPPAGD